MEAIAAKRKTLIRMALRRVKAGSGSHVAFLRDRTLKNEIADLNRIFFKTPFVIVGGVATRLYMPERMTLDLDVLVAEKDKATAEKELGEAGGKKTGLLSIGGSTWALYDGKSLDLIISDEDWTKDAIGNPVIHKEDRLPYIAIPYLILMKMRAGRMQDLADVGRMLGHAEENDIKKIRKVIKAYHPELSEDLESLVVLGKLEIG